MLLSTAILRLKYKFFNPLSKLMTKETKPWFRFCRIPLFNQDRFRLVHRRFFFKLLCCRYLDNRYFYSIRTIILLWSKSMSKNLLVCIGLSLIAKRGEERGGGGWWGHTTNMWVEVYNWTLVGLRQTVFNCNVLRLSNQTLWLLHFITD